MTGQRTPTTAIDWRPLARSLADQLTAAGALPADWYTAFADTPRHVFVPRFYDGDDLVDGTDSGQKARWLAAVYSDASLVTQQATAPGTGLAWPTSSTTMPSLMARMLALMQVGNGHQLLEIGTGTGYNAAIASHRLGASHVVSVDIDPDLVDAARATLAGLGYRPRLVTGDGATGVPEAAPFDRIIATAAVQAIPPAWITQLAAGGRIVADLRGEIASTLTAAHHTTPDTVLGRFHPIPGHFMWLRATADNPLRDGGTWPATPDRDNAQHTTTHIPPDVFDNPAARFVTQLYLPDARYLRRTEHPEPGHSGTEIIDLATTGGGWARITTTPGPNGAYPVAHGGPDEAWERLAAAISFWDQHHQPTPDRFGYTSDATGTTRYWIDSPDNTLRSDP
jgi:protein-L-isoaspartate O-methyltransferase